MQERRICMNVTQAWFLGAVVLLTYGIAKVLSRRRESLKEELETVYYGDEEWKGLRKRLILVSFLNWAGPTVIFIVGYLARLQVELWCSRWFF